MWVGVGGGGGGAELVTAPIFPYRDRAAVFFNACCGGLCPVLLCSSCGISMSAAFFGLASRVLLIAHVFILVSVCVFVTGNQGDRGY